MNLIKKQVGDLALFTIVFLFQSSLTCMKSIVVLFFISETMS